MAACSTRGAPGGQHRAREPVRRSASGKRVPSRESSAAKSRSRGRETDFAGGVRGRPWPRFPRRKARAGATIAVRATPRKAWLLSRRAARPWRPSGSRPVPKPARRGRPSDRPIGPDRRPLRRGCLPGKRARHRHPARRADPCFSSSSAGAAADPRAVERERAEMLRGEVIRHKDVVEDCERDQAFLAAPR